MPTYEYECKACGNRFDVFQGITDKPLKRCPSCKSMKARRLIGRGAGIIFRGSGFYQTDYRSESYRKRASEEKSGVGQVSAKAETKSPASRSDSSEAKKKPERAAAGKE